MRKLLGNIQVIFSMYTFVLFLRLTFLFLKQIGGIRIEGSLPKPRAGMIVVANHPDVWDCMAEVFMVSVLFAPLKEILLHPLKAAPWVAPDQRNFMSHRLWKLFIGPRAIPIQRGNGSGGLKELRQMKRILAGCNGPIVVHPEAGRTCTAPADKLLRSKKGHKLRPLKSSVAWLARRVPGSSILPIWVDNGDVPQQPGKPLFSWPNLKRGPMVIKIGQLMVLDEELRVKDPRALTEIITANLLELADKE